MVGFDDVPLAEFSIPSLTTIRQPHLEIGIQAVRLILKLIQNPNETPESVYLKGDLIIRESAHRYQN